jgi:hypothetical protein
MNRKWLSALALAPLAMLCLTQRDGRAADHLDSPGAMKDPAADITDVYAFTAPGTTGRLVLVMNVFPLATSAAKFSDKVEYWFRIREITGTSPVTLGPTALDIKCTADAAAAKMTCAAPGSLTKTVDIGMTTGGATDDIRVFAGLRSDPFFFDLDAFKKTVKDKAPAFTMPGKNFFKDANVLSIVVELDVNKAFGKAAPILTVAAETMRTGS